MDVLATASDKPERPLPSLTSLCSRLCLHGSSLRSDEMRMRAPLTAPGDRENPLSSYEGRGRTQTHKNLSHWSRREVPKQRLGDGVSLLVLLLHEELDQFAG